MNSALPSKKLSHIQGLRSVAVVVVILFHAGIPIHGGYLGVDMFFVISGYVISRMLYSEYQKNDAINLVRFFKRRIMRLAPVASITIIFSLFTGYLFLSNESLKISSWTGLANVFSIANFSTYYFTKDYFSAPTESNLFLHYWSLAVEEQFYIFTAIAILILGNFKNRLTEFRKYQIFFVASGLSLLCFIFSFLPISGFSSLFNFYSPVPRIWEFSVGMFVLILEKRKGIAIGNHLKLNIFFYMLLAATLFLGNPETSYRGPATLLAVLSTAGLIRFASQETKTNLILLKNPVSVFIGDISYSLYLWHWPILTLSNKVFPKDMSYLIASLLLIFCLSIISFYLLENFFRQRYENKNMFSFSFAIPAIALIACLLVLFQLRGTQISSGADHLKPGVYMGDTGHVEFHKFIEKNNYPCLPLSIRIHAVNEGLLRCWQSKSDSVQEIAIIGDSHSEHLFPGIAKVFPDLNVVYFDTLGLPIYGLDQSDRILKHVAESKTIKLVILNTYWSIRGVPTKELKTTVDYLVKNGKKIILTNDVPTFSIDPYYCKYPPFKKIRDSLCEQSKQLSYASLNDYIGNLQHLVGTRKDVLLVETFKDFCTGRNCSMVKDGKILFRDSNHLSLEGSGFVATRIKKEIEAKSLL
jgi:peptidoglycan/LPS O-acetylase OafA/YrhL